jgi:hypothetical protein
MPPLTRSRDRAARTLAGHEPIGSRHLGTPEGLGEFGVFFVAVLRA